MYIQTFQLVEDGGVVLGSAILEAALDYASCVVFQRELEEATPLTHRAPHTQSQ